MRAETYKMNLGMKNKEAFWGWMTAVWVWPFLLLLFTFNFGLDADGPRFLYKLTWVLYAGALLGLAVALAYKTRHWYEEPWVLAYLALTVLSFFLLPFGLGKWEPNFKGVLALSSDWYYVPNLELSLLLHTLPPLVIGGLITGEFTVPGDGRYDVGTYTPPQAPPRARGFMEEESWMDHVWDGTGGTYDYIGMHGEFDRNDESRRISEEIQQFHRAHPDADLSEHFYWDDIRDAETDGYLDD